MIFQENRDRLPMSLNKFYMTIGTTRQNVHSSIKRLQCFKDLEQQIIHLVRIIRRDHPTMGMRTMYFKMSPLEIGRDAFEEICLRNGFKVPIRKNFRITTDSTNTRFFPNLIEKLLIDRMNQVWQSDITYYEIGGRFYYITLIQDSFTKVIVGHWASNCLRTEDTTVPALKCALKRFKNHDLSGLIFHSDGGGQYYDLEFLRLTKEFQNSMGKSSYENAMSESLNNVVKNKYLVFRGIKSLTDLKKELDRTVELYNSEKPHSSLHNMTPYEFEKSLNFGSQSKAKMTESFDAEIQMNGASSPLHLLQSKAQNPDVFSAETPDYGLH